MIDTDLLQSNYIGRDGFKWWIGQVADPLTSGWGSAKDANDKTGSAEGESKKYTRRCKVRILGYHTISDADGYVLKDSDLPWAHIMVSPGEETGIYGTGSLHHYKGGESVLGFFMDGDDAQQPVILGGFGRVFDNINESKDTPESDPQTDCIIKPFKPQYSPELKQSHLIVTNDNQSSTSGVSALTGQSVSAQSKSFATKVHAAEPGSNQENKSNNQRENFPSISRESDISPGTNFVSGIQAQVEGLLNALKNIQIYKQTFFDAVSSEIDEISNIVKGYSKVIAGLVRKILSIFNGNLLKEFSNSIITSLSRLLPESLKNVIIPDVLARARDTILCVANNIYNGNELYENILGLIKDTFLENGESGAGGVLTRIIDNTICAVEDFTVEIINKIFKPIIDSISGTLDLFQSIVDRAESIAGKALGKLTSTLSFVLDILNCAGGDPTGYRPAAIWPPKRDASGSFEQILSRVNLPVKIPLPEGFENLPPRNYSCDSNIGYYLPPILKISGDFVGIPVVGDDGKILSIYIKEPGRGYSSLNPPAISIIQPGVWGEGGGARAKPIVNENDGSIADIIITNPGKGYTSQPFVAAAAVDPEVPLDLLPLPRISEQINVLPYLDTLYVESPGVGYSKDDKIYINDKELSEYGINYEIDIGPSGSIFSIDTRNGNNFPLIFNQYPNVSVISPTGVGAKITPNLNFFRLEEFVTDDDGNITITDENFVRSQGPLQIKSNNLVKVVNCIRK